VTYTVSGIVTLDGKAVSGAGMTVTGSGVSCTSSGSTGMYSCQAQAGSSFSLTPTVSLSNGGKVTWTPASQSFTSISASATANFAGISTTVIYKVSGNVLLDGKPVIGAPIKVTGSGATCGASNGSGVFTCNVNAGANLVLSPNVTPKSGTSISWTPASLTLSNVTANISTANFSGKTVLLARTLSGVVKVSANGITKPLAGVAMTASVSGVTCSLSNSAGNYSCTTNQSVPFALTPTFGKTGYVFRWPTASIPATGNVQINFTGSAICPNSGCNL
jgi:hypothetical protein